MTRPDHTLQDETRLRFLSQHPAPNEGLATVSVDLAAFFALVRRVGRDEALLLLLIRALRQRSGSFVLKVHDLAWMLRVSERRVIRWLDRLTRARLVVYHVEDVWGIDSVAVELADASSSEPPFTAHVRHELPSHWFVQVLPLVGRTTFTVYLYFHGAEQGIPEVYVDHIVSTVRLKGRWHARLHIRRLRRGALLRVDDEDDGVLLLTDPPPPTRSARLRLRFRALPYLRRALLQIAGGIAAVVLAAAGLFLLRHFLPPRS
jgi:hypothetical protein